MQLMLTFRWASKLGESLLAVLDLEVLFSVWANSSEDVRLLVDQLLPAGHSELLLTRQAR